MREQWEEGGWTVDTEGKKKKRGAEIINRQGDYKDKKKELVGIG